MDIFSQYKGLPKQVYIICGSRMVTAMGGFIYSFNSLFMTGILGISEVTTGYLLIIYSLAGVAGAFICGRLADMYGRKKIFALTMGLAVSSLIICGFFVYSKVTIFFLMVISFCGSGFLPTCAAMVTDSTTADNRRESFSLMFLCINLGFAMGQVFAGRLFYNYIRWIFWGQAIFFGASTILLLTLTKETYIPTGRRGGETKTKHKGVIKAIIRDKVLVLFLLAVLLSYGCYVQINYMMPLHFNSCLGLEDSAKWVSNVWMINGLFCVIWSPILLRLTNKFSQTVNMAIAAVMYIVGFGAFSLVTEASNLWITLVATAIWTAGETLISTGSGVFIGGRAPEEHRAAFQSLFEVFGNLGRCIGPVSMGHFLTGFSYQAGWMVVSGICVLMMFILLIAIYIDKGEKDEQSIKC